MNNLRLRFAQNAGFWVGVLLFAILYTLYSSLHPKGWSVDLFVQNSNESFALIMVSMAQTVPVITGGLDLSVGPIMTLTNCLASVLVSGPAGAIVLGILASLAAGARGVLDRHVGPRAGAAPQPPRTTARVSTMPYRAFGEGKAGADPVDRGGNVDQSRKFGPQGNMRHRVCSVIPAPACACARPATDSANWRRCSLR